MHFKILHKIELHGYMLSKFVATDDICVFCEREGENLTNLFYECQSVIDFGENLAEHYPCFWHEGYNICYYCNDNKTIEIIVNVFISCCQKLYTQTTIP